MPPRVSQLSWNGTSLAITSISLTFTAPLDQSLALNPADYRLIDLDAGNQVIQVNPPAYNSVTYTVTLVPSSPLASGRYYQIQILGTGPTAVRDIAGNLLDGSANGRAGSNYVASFAQGTRLQYLDGAGNKVTLKLTGGGYLEQVRDAAGDGQVLELIGPVPHRSTLSGKVHKTVFRTVRRSTRTSGRTNLGVIQGLGRFGDVRVRLKSPPFFVNQFPFQRKGRGVF
jgi:hypothetical protein